MQYMRLAEICRDFMKPCVEKKTKTGGGESIPPTVSLLYRAMTRIRKKDEGGRRRRERSAFHLHTNPRRKGREQEGCSAAGWGFLFRVEGSTAVKRS